MPPSPWAHDHETEPAELSDPGTRSKGCAHVLGLNTYQMSSVSTRLCCELSRGMMCRDGQRERCSRRTKRSSRRTDSIRDKIALVCASFCSCAGLRFLAIYSTTSSNLYCDRLASTWHSEMTSPGVKMTSKQRRDRTRMTRQPTRGRFYWPPPDDREDALPSHPCTMSRLSNHDYQDKVDCLEHQSLGCRMNEPNCRWSNGRRYPRIDIWRQTQLSSAGLLTEARIRKGMG